MLHKEKARLVMNVCDAIIILASKSYYEGLLDKEERVWNEFLIAEETQRPILILFTTELKKNEIDLLKTYFSRLNVKGELIIDENYLEDGKFALWVKEKMDMIRYKNVAG